MLPQTLQWIGDENGSLRLIDQTQLPEQCVMIDCHLPEQVWQAIRQLSVRGAPAIGIAAAYGVVLATQGSGDPARAARAAIAHLATSRPTAVNLFWALRRMEEVVERALKNRAETSGETPSDDAIAMATAPLPRMLLQEAIRIHDEDRALCAQMSKSGAPLIAPCEGVLTHCNAGSLATSHGGTALGVIYAAHALNPRLRVFADETRPLWQGARLTAWELTQAGIDVTVICDSMAAHVMRQGWVQAVIVGADRIAANGDTANKIGTYALAIAARYHQIPFYVAAPYSTFDLATSSGESIPIEERPREEIGIVGNRTILPPAAGAYNPAFDVTPASLITALITDRGVIFPPYGDNISQLQRR